MSQVDINPKALFLGPYSENREEFSRLINIVISDITQWRRNYHPKENRIINPEDKTNALWTDTMSNLERELDKMLGDLKQSIPFHNPRFIGHMHSDLVIPSLLGYLAGQLYNQNNVVGESSPVTTEKEVRFIEYLCKMFHYPRHEYSENIDINEEISSTGHLTSGGTIANIESLWSARNIKYFPLSLKLLFVYLKDKDGWEQVQESIGNIKLTRGAFKDYTASELFNLNPSEVLNLHSELKLQITPYLTSNSQAANGKLQEEQFANALNGFTIRRMGTYGIHKAIREILEEELELPYLIVPESRHYSWEKAMDVLGLGSERIKYVKVDDNFKVDIIDFKKKCLEATHIIMVVAVVGTTEEGVIDPISSIINTKEEIQIIKGFWLHIDAAYGGYYISFVNNPNGGFHTVEELQRKFHSQWINEDILNDFKSLGSADSITIDPHKLGYIPYSAGAILFRDNRVKPFIEKRAPYLSVGESESFDSTKLYLGGSALEGSRSGAAALACYLSSKVIPSHSGGYGKLMEATFKNASVFLDIMNQSNSKDDDEQTFSIQVHPLYNSLTNIICYSVGLKGVQIVPDIFNILNDRLYKEMSAEKNKLLNDYKFIVSKSSLKYSEYKSQIDIFLSKFEIPINNTLILKEKDFELVFLRSTLMNPLMSDEVRERTFNDYFAHLRKLVNRILPEIIFQHFLEMSNFVRIKVLWVENQNRLQFIKKSILNGGNNDIPDISRFLDIDFVNNTSNNTELKDYQVFIVDLNLLDSHHKEWQSGIEVIKEIKSNCNNPVILVYSQFLNKKFKILKQDGTEDETLNQVNHHEIIRNYLKHNFQLKEDCFVPKSLPKLGIKDTDQKPIELQDLSVLTTKLAKQLFNHLTSLV